ncbi:UDP-2,3-diacylglucosamine diphosphatase [Piscinibacter sakaiensis]|uniref:UDP-2,3-diacylglucosamine hydrolase n=1 Tax=Piscinibacter sakaiensis TaxID=1547922 RepID=A0A0K8NZ63_PISS1|nr:UDP-2,3-diacylglucosamine diphosphatase [Piscinibacter sakaiensis]GAP35663.1 UDP-2,3-diacylglucosamine hydrolase [Piscinibacter sakaiensis]
MAAGQPSPVDPNDPLREEAAAIGLPPLPPPALAGDPHALPRFWELKAPQRWQQIDFISDLHLAADRPRTLQAFADYLEDTPADAVFILGDLFDLWAGDDTRRLPFEGRCAELLAEAATRRAVLLMVGNRDFLVGAEFARACGITALADPTVLLAFGRRHLLSHGDALCLADVGYQRFRAQVRDPAWQQRFLAQPLEQRLAQAQAVRQNSERRRGEGGGPGGEEPWTDIDPHAAVRWMHEAGTPVLIHGHTHMPGSEPLAPGFVRHVLSDWDFDGPGDGPGAGARAELLRLSAQGLLRLPLAAPR